MREKSILQSMITELINFNDQSARQGCKMKYNLRVKIIFLKSNVLKWDKFFIRMKLKEFYKDGFSKIRIHPI